MGTPGFLSPEMFGESYNELVDIWSFGMCVLEMATNQYPYIEYNGSVAQLLRKGFEGAKPEALSKRQRPRHERVHLHVPAAGGEEAQCKAAAGAEGVRLI